MNITAFQVELCQFVWEKVRHDGIEVNPCVIPRFVKVLQDVMQSHTDSVIHRPVFSVGKLKRIQQGSSDVLWEGQDQSFTWLNDHRLESNRSVTIKASDFGLFGDGNDGGAFGIHIHTYIYIYIYIYVCVCQVKFKSSWALLSFRYMCGHTVGRDVVPHRTTVLHKYRYTTRSKPV